MKNTNERELQEQREVLDAIYGMIEEMKNNQQPHTNGEGMEKIVEKMDNYFQQSNTVSLKLMEEFNRLREDSHKEQEASYNLWEEKFQVMEQVRGEIKKQSRIDTARILFWKGFLVYGVLMLLFLVSLYFNYQQWQRIGELSDNDLKYRYVKMLYGGENKSINSLDSVFIFQRERLPEFIERVEGYEYRIRQAAERNNRIEYNLRENERLLQEIEKLKER